MNNAHQNFISDESGLAKRILAEYGELSQQNVLWAGTPNYDELITQEDIDSVVTLAGAGLTTTQLADACYALEQVRGILTNAMPSLTILAKLPRFV